MAALFPPLDLANLSSVWSGTIAIPGCQEFLVSAVSVGRINPEGVERMGSLLGRTIEKKQRLKANRALEFLDRCSAPNSNKQLVTLVLLPQPTAPTAPRDRLTAFSKLMVEYIYTGRVGAIEFEGEDQEPIYLIPVQKGDEFPRAIGAARNGWSWKVDGEEQECVLLAVAPMRRVTTSNSNQPTSPIVPLNSPPTSVEALDSSPVLIPAAEPIPLSPKKSLSSIYVESPSPTSSSNIISL